VGGGEREGSLSHETSKSFPIVNQINQSIQHQISNKSPLLSVATTEGFRPGFGVASHNI
jgi:hypothetical protein